MKALYLAVLVALVALVAGCPMPPTPPGGEECDAAYGHLADVGCEPPKPASGTWVDVCRNGRRNGVFELKCLNRASTTDALKVCGVTCTPK